MQHNLLAVATLPWEISPVHNDTCKLKTLDLMLHSVKHNKFNCTTKGVQVHLLQQMFENVFLFPLHRPYVSSAIRQQHHKRYSATVRSMCQSSAASDRSRLDLASDKRNPA